MPGNIRCSGLICRIIQATDSQLLLVKVTGLKLKTLLNPGGAMLKFS